MNFKILYIPVIFLLLSCSKLDLVEVRIGETTLSVEIASTDMQRQKGLMDRDSLEKDKGMIFVFDKERQVSFWMKNTRIPLDIAYINKKGEILEIYHMKPYSLEPVTSKRSSILYALEVNDGYFNENSITIGDRLNLDPILDYLKSSN